MAPYIRNGDLASLTRRDWDFSRPPIQPTGMWPVSPGETGIFRGPLYSQLGCGQSHPVRLGFFEAPYTANWDVASLTR